MVRSRGHRQAKLVTMYKTIVDTKQGLIPLPDMDVLDGLHDKIMALRHAMKDDEPKRIADDYSELRARIRNTEKPKPKPASNGISSESQALEVLDLKKPFTQAELKKRRAGLLQKIHPDQGGSAMMTRMVNDAYDLLKTKK